MSTTATFPSLPGHTKKGCPGNQLGHVTQGSQWCEDGLSCHFWPETVKSRSESFLAFLFNVAGVQELSEAETQIPESVLKDNYLAHIPLVFAVSYVYTMCSDYIHPSLPSAIGLSSPSEHNKSPSG